MDIRSTIYNKGISKAAKSTASKVLNFIGILSIVLNTFGVGLLLTSNLNPAYAATVPENQVGISMFSFVLSGSYSLVSGQPTGVGQIKNGNVGSYPEGSCIPVEIEVTNNSASAGDVIVSPYFDYYNGVVGLSDLEKITTPLSGNPRSSANNLNNFSYTGSSLTSVASFASTGGAIPATVTGPYSGGNAGTSPTTSTDSFRHYNVTLSNVPAGNTVYMIMCGRLGVDASQYSGGSSLSIRVVQGGNENIPIPVNQLLILPSITIVKNVSGGTATADQWSFNVSPAIGGISTYPIPSGQNSVVINNVSPDGAYTITESGPSGYNFSSGSGTNCTFSGSTATATVAADKPIPVNSTCTFNNTLSIGTLIVKKVVVNDNGGTLKSENFSFSVNGGTAALFEADGQNNLTVNAGTYTVTEPAVAGYSTSYDNCSGLVIPNGGSATCTITNDDQFGRIIIDKVTNPSEANQSFSFNLTGGPSSLNQSFDLADTTTPYDSGIVLPGLGYSVSEIVPGGWNQTSATCDDGSLVSNIDVAPGETVTCTFTNRQLSTGLTLDKSNSTEGSFVNPGMDVVYKIVITNNGEDTVFSPIEVLDILPEGFTYKDTSATVDGIPSEPTVTLVGNVYHLTWLVNDDLASGKSITIIYTATVGLAVKAGTYDNTAVASGKNRAGGPVVSNEGTSSVVVKVPAVLSEVTETPAVLPMTNEGNGPDLPIWPLLLITTGSVLKLTEKIGRRYLTA